MRNPRHKQQLLAVLIDAENSSAALARPLLHRAASYGVLAVKRAYGDWSRPELRRAQQALCRLAIEPVQCLRRATGKNASDLSLSIDAMDLLHTGQLDGMCIVSSDSDFAPLAMRIRLDGLRVYGFGARHTPAGFVAACDKFIFMESLVLETA